LKLGWTRFWVSASVMLCIAAASSQSAGVRLGHRQAGPALRKNELTLGGVRPGRDSVGRMIKVNGAPILREPGEPAQWADLCRGLVLYAEIGTDNKVQTLRLVHDVAAADCEVARNSGWQTGRGLRLNDECGRVAALYGNPDSRSPSTKDGQPLELLYYAFDWAGPDVPQVMQVVCTTEKDGQAGRVVQITLAASSL